MEQLEPINICTYRPKNPAFDPERVMLRSLLFINEDRTKYVSVGCYPAATIYHWWNLGLSGEAVDPKTSSSAMNKWTQWRRACLCYGTPCV